MRSLANTLFVSVLVLIASCGGGGGGGGGGDPVTPTPTVGEPPVASFVVSAPEGSKEVSFNAAGSVDNDGRIVDYSWDFDDGTTETVQEPTIVHVYADEVDRSVQLMVTDDEGQTDSFTISVPVGEAIGQIADATYSISGTIAATAEARADIDVNNLNASSFDNNTIANAQQVNVPMTLGGWSSASELRVRGQLLAVEDSKDFYELSTNVALDIILQISDASSADLDIFLYDENENFLDSSTTGVGDNESFSITTAQITASTSKRFYVEVRAQSGRSNYVLSAGDNVAPTILSQVRFSDDFIPGEVIVRYKDDRVGIMSESGGTVSGMPGVRRVAGHARTSMLCALDESYVVHNRYVTTQSDAKGMIPQHKFNALSWRDQRKMATAEAIKKLQKQDNVLYAEPNYIRKPLTEPFDSLYHLQWHYPLISLPDAWDLAEELGDGVIVAVIDTGVLLNHPDLSGQLVNGYDFISELDNSNDGDGIDDNPNDSGDSTFSSSSFHGTHVAGTIAAKTERVDGATGDTGVAGIAWDAKVMPMRALGVLGGTTYDTTQAMLYAAGLPNDSGTVPTKKADIINMSFGGAGFSQNEQSVVNQVNAAGVIMVAASGNEGTSTAFYPASHNHVVSVGAVDINKSIAFYSNNGPFVDVAGPGGNMISDNNLDGFGDGILSTLGDDSGADVEFTYQFYQGTSMAAPHVAGVIALMKAEKPDMTPENFDALLQSGELTEDLGDDGRDNFYGYGLINAYKAVRAAKDLDSTTPFLLISPSDMNFGKLNRLPIEAFNGGGGSLSITSIVSDQTWLTYADNSVDASGFGTYDVIVDRDGLSDGTYTGTLTFTSTENTQTAEVTMSVDSGSTTADAGLIYVLVYNTRTGAADPDHQAEVSAVDGVYTYTLEGLEPGVYKVFAGTDNDLDNIICDSGEACGAYPLRNREIEVTLNSDKTDINFDIGYQADLGNNASSLSLGSMSSSMSSNKSPSKSLGVTDGIETSRPKALPQ